MLNPGAGGGGRGGGGGARGGPTCSRRRDGRDRARARRSTPSSASRATVTTAAARRRRGARWRWRRRSPGRRACIGHRDYVDQGAPARRDRTARRRHLHGRDDSDGHAERRVGRVGRLLRAQLVRQPRAVRHAGRRRARARGDDRADDQLDRRANSKRRCPRQVVFDRELEVRGQPQSRDCELRGDHPAVDVRCSAAAPGMWLQVELPQIAQRLTEIAVRVEPLSASSKAQSCRARRRGRAAGAAAAPPVGVGFPIAYQVQVSTDGTTWSAPVAQGAGAGALTTITFAPVQAKFVKITQTGTAADAPPLAIQRLKLFEAPAASSCGAVDVQTFSGSIVHAGSSREGPACVVAPTTETSALTYQTGSDLRRLRPQSPSSKVSEHTHRRTRRPSSCLEAAVSITYRVWDALRTRATGVRMAGNLRLACAVRSRVRSSEKD